MDRQTAIATATRIIEDLNSLLPIYDTREDGHDTILNAIAATDAIKGDLLQQEDWAEPNPLIHALEHIRNLCDAPFFNADRRVSIRDIADKAIRGNA